MTVNDAIRHRAPVQYSLSDICIKDSKFIQLCISTLPIVSFATIAKQVEFNYG
jgi:hypothetical protein